MVGALRVNRARGGGVCLEVVQILKSYPMRAFSLRELVEMVPIPTTIAELASLMHKMTTRQKVVRERWHNGVRMINRYRWRVPHGR